MRSGTAPCRRGEPTREVGTLATAALSFALRRVAAWCGEVPWPAGRARRRHCQAGRPQEAGRGLIPLLRVPGGSGDVGASGRGMPDQDPWFRLLEPPALGLFGAMMVPAQRSQTAFARDPALVPGDRMVQVASGCGSSAAWRGAPGVPRLDQVLEVAAGAVSRFGVLVVAPAAGDRGHPDAQVAQPVLGRDADWRWVATAGAAVGGRGAVRVQAGYAPAGPWISGRRDEQVQSIFVVDQPESIHLGQGPGLALQPRPGKRDGDQRGQARAGVLAGRAGATGPVGSVRIGGVRLLAG